ncbi:hypothetical protein OOZ15_18305 [Galbibacter sp. EGI 63066]|uniref:hypothetical protein n=1 Tax=Galbibacter sp. EGI 63066 TaxID=2993559 RepID=UPI0022496120|nr:hypothetical protein [Galbibacter sp. EGI 63066]MCX2681911.1 hypothetical protein [Galbibacter sp. EGI 63066]
METPYGGAVRTVEAVFRIRARATEVPATGDRTVWCTDPVVTAATLIVEGRIAVATVTGKVVPSVLLVSTTLGINTPLFDATTSSCAEGSGEEAPIPTCEYAA